MYSVLKWTTFKDTNIKLWRHVAHMQTYTYPDGTTSSTRPKDGDKASTYDGNGAQSTWMWDDLLGQWYRIMITSLPSPVDFGFINVEISITDSLGTECECGAKHTSSPQLHLSFCPLWSPKT